MCHNKGWHIPISSCLSESWAVSVEACWYVTWKTIQRSSVNCVFIWFKVLVHPLFLASKSEQSPICICVCVWERERESEQNFSSLYTPSINWTVQSQSHIATDGKSWCRAPSRAHDQKFITVWQLRTSFCGAPSLTWGWVCFFFCICCWPLPAQSSSGPSPSGLATMFYCLIWDFPFCRLLRLAGSRWRYSTPPPHGDKLDCQSQSQIYIATDGQ
jgi:hypothetical protein